jgi:type IV secretion system protein VirB8
MKADAALETYFAEAASWDADRVALKARSERIAWIVAAGGWLLALLLGAALLLLTPLKRVEPFVVRVDNSTGIVDVVPVYAGGGQMPEVFTRYLLTHYVTTCERFNFATAESDYEECGAFHSAQRNQAWYSEWNPSNPASPLNTFKDGTTLRAEVESVSFFKRGTGVSDLAQVRYVKEKRAVGSAEPQRSHWIATIQYVYAEAPKDPKVRRWNPLGLKIVDFHPEPEVLNESKAAAGPSP